MIPFKPNNLKLLVSIFFISTLSSTYAQNITKSQVYNDHRSYDPTIVGEDDDYFYVFSDYKRDYMLECYDKHTLKNKYKTIVKSEEKIGRGKDAGFSKFTFAEDKFIVFYQYHDKTSRKDQHYKLYAKTFNASDGKPDGKKELLDIEVEKKKRKGSFTILSSTDKSKIFLEHAAYHKSLRKVVRKFMLLNSDLEVLYESEALPSEDVDIPYYYIVDNDGSIYYIRYYPDENKLMLASLDANRDYEKWEEPLTLDIKAEEIQLSSIELNINKNNELTFTGLYSVKKAISNYVNRYSLTGAFYISMDHESKEIKHNKVHTFPDEFLDQFKTERQLKKQKDVIVNSDFNRLRVINREDGGVIVVGEMYDYIVTNTRNNMYSKTITYTDIAVFNFDKDGELLWSQRIPKNQLFNYTSLNGILIFSSRGFRMFVPPNPYNTTKYFSYYSGIHDGKLVILYNDKFKNIEKRNNVNARQKPYKKPHGTVVHRYTIDLETGEYKSFADNKMLDANVYLRPKTYYQKDENSASYLFAQKGKDYKYIKLSE